MKNKVILLVEDSRRDEELTLRTLHKNHIKNEVVVTRDGEEALDYLFGSGKYADRNIAELPMLVLLDIHLPKVDGLEVVRQIRADDRTRPLPIVILTASKEDSERLTELESEASSFVRKPIDFVELSQAIQQLGLYWLISNDSHMAG